MFCEWYLCNCGEHEYEDLYDVTLSQQYHRGSRAQVTLDATAPESPMNTTVQKSSVHYLEDIVNGAKITAFSERTDSLLSNGLGQQMCVNEFACITEVPTTDCNYCMSKIESRLPSHECNSI